MLMDFVSSTPYIFLWKDIMLGWTMTECHGCEPESGSRGGGVWPWMVSSSLECREDQCLLMRLYFRWSVTGGSAVKPQSLLGAAKRSMGGPPRNSWELGFWSRYNTACIVVWWRARAWRPVWAKMSPYVFGVYTALILWGFRNQFYWMFCVWSSSIFDKAQMGVWNIGKLGTRTSSILREWVM